MGWEPEKIHRTLLIEKWSQGGKTFYAVYPHCRVLSSTGATYLEPIPFDAVFGSRDVFRFAAVEFIDSPSVNRQDTAGDLGITNVREDGVRRGA